MFYVLHICLDLILVKGMGQGSHFISLGAIQTTRHLLNNLYFLPMTYYASLSILTKPTLFFKLPPLPFTHLPPFHRAIIRMTSAAARLFLSCSFLLPDLQMPHVSEVTWHCVPLSDWLHIYSAEYPLVSPALLQMAKLLSCLWRSNSPPLLYPHIYRWTSRLPLHLGC